MATKLLVIILLIAIWTIPWKGLALWKSARRGDRAWFIALLLINTVGVLELLYIFFFSERKNISNK
jgi:hypothetical protein